MAGHFAKIPRAACRAEVLGRPARVLIAIGIHADANGGAFPSLSTIAKETGIDRGEIPKIIRKLERSGDLLECDHRRGIGNRYRLLGVGKSADGAETDGKSARPLSANFPATVGKSADLTESKQNTKQREPRARIGLEGKGQKHPIPADWKPSSIDCHALAERGVDAEIEAAAFRAHSEKHGTLLADWDAGFRSWYLKPFTAKAAAPAVERPPAPVLTEAERKAEAILLYGWRQSMGMPLDVGCNHFDPDGLWRHEKALIDAAAFAARARKRNGGAAVAPS